MNSIFDLLHALFQNAMSNGILGMAGLLFFSALIGATFALMILYSIEAKLETKLETKHKTQASPTFCTRTNRKCIGGAYDGNDGFSIDCPTLTPIECEHRQVYGGNVIFELHRG
jgi:hypothetical protein